MLKKQTTTLYYKKKKKNILLGIDLAFLYLDIV